MDAENHNPGPSQEAHDEVVEELTVIVPVYGEAHGLPATLCRIDEAISASAVPTAVLFVDDGSPDDSVAVLHAHAQKHSYIRVVALEGNHGQHTAVFAGIDLARSEIVATMEAHPEHDVADLFELYATMTEQVDLVGGVRIKRTIPWWRKVGSWCLNRALMGLGVSPFADLGCQLVVWRKNVAYEAFYMAAYLPWHQGLGHLLAALKSRTARNHPVQCRHTSDRPSAYNAITLLKGALVVLWTALRLRTGLAPKRQEFAEKPYVVRSDTSPGPP